MWLMTPHGFFSAVQTDEDPEVLTIRARVRTDLEDLIEMLDTRGFLDDERPRIRELGPARDYAFRINLNKTEWMRACAAFAEDIDYSNFKSEVQRVQGKERSSVYSNVWWELLSLQPEKDWSQISAWPENWTDEGSDREALLAGFRSLDYEEDERDQRIGSPHGPGRNKAVREFLNLRGCKR